MLAIAIVCESMSFSPACSQEQGMCLTSDPTFKNTVTQLWHVVQVCVSACASSPGGVYASMEVCTTSERLLEGIGTAIFLSTWRANTACTASECTSERARDRSVFSCRTSFSVFCWLFQSLIDLQTHAKQQ